MTTQKGTYDALNTQSTHNDPESAVFEIVGESECDPDPTNIYIPEFNSPDRKATIISAVSNLLSTVSIISFHSISSSKLHIDCWWWYS